MKPAEFTAKSTMTQGPGGFRFTFFCECCGAGHTTGSIGAETVREAFEHAQTQARTQFNRCHRCHRWVCDSHYNEDVMMCTDCAPKQ